MGRFILPKLFYNLNKLRVNNTTKKGSYMNKKIALILGAIFVMFSGTFANAADPIVTESTSNSTVTTSGKNETTVKSPPPSAISPSINNSNSDVCTVAYSGAVQTQVLGISAGGTIRDLNCERLKLSKVLYDMGMKVAAVSNLCHDERVFRSMEMAGTPCPFMGKIGDEAAQLWETYPELRPERIKEEEEKNDFLKGLGSGILGAVMLLLLL